MKLRPYDPQRDKEAAYRIWHEVGWMEKDNEKQKEATEMAINTSRAFVAEIDGQAECLVIVTPATIRYIDQDLPFSAITAVATSRVARKQGLASHLTAQAIAADAADGALVAGLGVFEQGYYNQLGFGNGSYEHRVSFDPARLRVDVETRVPRRISSDDWEMVHASRLARHRRHGACNLIPPEFTRFEMRWNANSFGLGYCDGPDGALTHHFWGRIESAEHGPYAIPWMTFQTAEQFLELMALIRSLGDQVRCVKMCEPPGIQLQDLLDQPLKQQHVSRKTRFESSTRALACWQVRICDLPGCLRHTHLRGDQVRFNLVLRDPIERFLAPDALWRGVAGEYVVTLGPVSSAELGRDASLPILSASVGAFTRMWFGVRPATSLAVTDDLSGPPELLEQLDWALLLPIPLLGWEI